MWLSCSMPIFCSWPSKVMAELGRVGGIAKVHQEIVSSFSCCSFWGCQVEICNVNFVVGFSGRTNA